MLDWNNWTDNGSNWDCTLKTFPDYSYLQSYSWGEYKKNMGWEVVRLFATHTQNTDTVSMAQILVKNVIANYAIAWIPGGPVGNINNINDKFLASLKGITNKNILYTRFSIHKEAISDDEEKILKSNGWFRPTRPITTGISMLYNPNLSEEQRVEITSSNWRHNLRRSMKKDISAYLWTNPDVAMIYSVYEAMQAYKGISNQFEYNELTNLIAFLNNHLRIVRCDDKQGKILAIRGAVIFGNKAWDILAAATPDGRKVYASHLAYWQLMKVCSNSGITYYDMGGVDAKNNKGVYDFKKGTGARLIKYIGEWDSAKFSLLRKAANIIISKKMKS